MKATKERKCEVEGCDRKHYAKGMCKPCYLHSQLDGVDTHELYGVGSSRRGGDDTFLRSELDDDIRSGYGFGTPSDPGEQRLD